MQITIPNLTYLPQVAGALIEFSQSEHFFIFRGEMGTGKTTFIKEFCTSLGVKDVVSSPTFSIVNEYQYENGLVYHFDCYRLKNIREAYDIGYEDYFYSQEICLIEWPEKVEELLPENYIEVCITIVNEHSRTFDFKRF